MNRVMMAFPVGVIYPMPEELIPDRELERMDLELQQRADDGEFEPETSESEETLHREAWETAWAINLAES